MPKKQTNMQNKLTKHEIWLMGKIISAEMDWKVDHRNESLKAFPPTPAVGSREYDKILINVHKLTNYSLDVLREHAKLLEQFEDFGVEEYSIK